MDQNYKGVCTTRPPGTRLDLWSQRRWDNKKLFMDGNMDGCEDGGKDDVWIAGHQIIFLWDKLYLLQR